MKAFLALVTLTLALTSVHTQHNDLDRDSANNIIFNGYVAPEGHVPYIVFLLLSNGKHFTRCGGIIIANTWILTAAHCLRNKLYVDIYYGTTTAEKSETTVRVGRENFVVHELFDSIRRRYDIALIRTPHVEFTNEIKKVDLPFSSLTEDLLMKVETKACGWGKISINETTDILHCVDLPIVSNKECSKNSPVIHKSMLCTGVIDGKSVNKGDSGGPLVIPNNPPILVGIVFFGRKVWKLNVYTRVTSYLKWIYTKTDFL